MTGGSPAARCVKRPSCSGFGSLASTGDRTTAATLARRFLTVYPASVHAERVEAVLRELTASRGP